MTKHMKQYQRRNVFSAIRGPGGEPWWVACTTSAWRASDNMILSRACLDKMVERADKGKGPPRSNELWLLHLPLRLGESRYRGRVDRWLVEAGTWDDTTLAKAVRAAVEREPDEWRISVSFEADGVPDKNGVVSGATMRERSVVPAEYAIEPWTSIATITQRRSKDMANIMEILKGLLPGAAEELLEELDQRAMMLDAAGIDSRADLEAIRADAKEDEEEDEEEAPEAEPQVTLESLNGAFEALHARVEDLATAVEGLASRLNEVPGADEMKEEVTEAVRASIGEELVTAVGLLQKIRYAFTPTKVGARGDVPEDWEDDEDDDDDADPEMVSALDSSRSAAEGADALNMLYL